MNNILAAIQETGAQAVSWNAPTWQKHSLNEWIKEENTNKEEMKCSFWNKATFMKGFEHFPYWTVLFFEREKEREKKGRTKKKGREKEKKRRMKERRKEGQKKERKEEQKKEERKEEREKKRRTKERRKEGWKKEMYCLFTHVFI